MAMALIHNHNCTVLADLQPGDTVEFKRGIYSHWAVYIGEGKVVHMAGDDNDGINANMNSGNVLTMCGKRFNKALVKVDYFLDVACVSIAYKNNDKDRIYSPCDVNEILGRAWSRVGEIGYNVLWHNCEHFASYCRYGIFISDQADKLLTFGIGTLGVGLIAMAIGGFRRFATRRDTH